MSTSNLISESERTGSPGDQESLREVLDFLVTEEQLGVTLVSAAIENAPGAPSEGFLPVLRNGVTTEYYHVEALKEVGGKPLTTKYWFPDAALDNGGIGVFETLEVIESIEISLYLIGVSAFARGAMTSAHACAPRRWAPRLSTARSSASHRANWARRSARPTTSASRTSTGPRSPQVREALEGLGIGYGVETSQPGRFYEYPGDPLANGVGTPVNHTKPH